MGALTESIAEFFAFPVIAIGLLRWFLPNLPLAAEYLPVLELYAKFCAKQDGGGKSSLALYQAAVYRDPHGFNKWQYSIILLQVATCPSYIFGSRLAIVYSTLLSQTEMHCTVLSITCLTVGAYQLLG